MTHIYKVSGMTCNGCKASVEEKLSAILNVDTVSANLNKAEVIITMKSHIEISEFQKALPMLTKIYTS